MLAEKNNLAYYKNLIAASEFHSVDDICNVKILYSKEATFAIPSALNLLSNALIKYKTGQNYSIKASIGKIPDVFEPEMSPETMSAIVDVFNFIYFPVLSLFVLHTLRESTCNIKQLQRMAGVSWISYWGSTYLFDFFIFLLEIICILITAIAFDSWTGYRLLYTKEIGKFV